MKIKAKTAAEARAYTDKVEKELLVLANAFSRADWVKSTNITDDTEAIAAEANQRFTDAAVAAAKKAATFDGVKVSPEVARKLKLLKVALVTPAPTGSVESKEVTTLLARLEGEYGKGKYTRRNKEGKDETLDLGALSNILVITPSYLKQIGLIDQEPDPSRDIGLLLRMALDKIAFLPFGLLVDQYRWKIFSGEIVPEDYNRAWWDLRLKYQGVAPPGTRAEDDFDAGAKYHVAANVPYTRYFLAHIQQFQFHRALCRAAGRTGPLNRCSIYASREAGAKLATMLAMGASKPWPDAMEALTGSRRMDVTAILDYFAPLQKWLDEQNQGVPVGW